jgi:hypothetical protein
MVWKNRVPTTCWQVFGGPKSHLTRVIAGENRSEVGDLLKQFSVLGSQFSAKQAQRLFAADERLENSFEFQVSKAKAEIKCFGLPLLAGRYFWSQNRFGPPSLLEKIEFGVGDLLKQFSVPGSQFSGEVRTFWQLCPQF